VSRSKAREELTCRWPSGQTISVPSLPLSREHEHLASAASPAPRGSERLDRGRDAPCDTQTTCSSVPPSISVVEPAAMRTHVLGPDFLDAEHHPEITFRSTAVRLADDGGVEVDGELTIRGVTRPVTASGHYAPPRPSSFGEIAGLQLRTSFDRREFGFDWQMELPGGGDAVSWDVDVDIDLLLKREDADPEGRPWHEGRARSVALGSE